MSTNSIENNLEHKNDDLTASSSNTIISRRRLAFRPQFAPNKPIKNIINSSFESTHESRTIIETNLKGISATSSTCDLEQKSPRRRLVTSWSFQEMLVFYEGIKQVIFIFFEYFFLVWKRLRINCTLYEQKENQKG